MRKYIATVKNAAFSKTARDTYILFSGNLLTAFFGFLYTVLLARGLSIEDFGIFSAASNIIFLLASFTDLGASNGLIRFISKFSANGKVQKEKKYIKAGFIIKLISTLAFSTLILVFAKFFALNFFATDNSLVSVWVAFISLTLTVTSFYPYVFQGQKKFIQSTLSEIIYSGSRVVFLVLLSLTGYSLFLAFGSFALAFLPATLFIFYFSGLGFIKSKPEKRIYIRLLKFSGWLGVNKVVSSFAGRLDVTMLASLVGATAVGLYSVPSRLALFIAMFAGSYSSVLAPRFSSFDSKDIEKKYLVKSTLALVPIILGIIVWIAVARPFITILFGQKFLPSVPVFQALIISYIPFIITAPAVSAIIYSIKKPVHIGVFSLFQIVGIFVINLIFIPKVGEFGPTIAFGVTHLVMAIYMWFVVIKYYWGNNKV